VTPTNSVTDADVTFSFANEELHTSACSTIEAWRSIGGANWASAGVLGTRTCGSDPFLVTYTGVTIQNTTSVFALRRTAAPTAITLLTVSTNNIQETPTINLLVALLSLASIGGIVIWRHKCRLSKRMGDEAETKAN